MIEIRSKIEENIRAEYERHLGIFLKDLRTSRSFSLRELGERTNINFPYLSHLEINKKEKAGIPSVNVLNKLFSVYNLTEKEKERFMEIYLNLVMPKIFINSLTDEKIRDIIKILEA